MPPRKVWLEDTEGKQQSTINYLKWTQHKVDFKLELQHFLGDFFGRFENQMPIYQTNIMLSKDNSTINLLHKMERNDSIVIGM